MKGETLLDSAMAAEGGRKIRVAAETAAERLPTEVGNIRAGCEAKPWGGDEAGQACDAALSSIVTVLDKTERIVEALRGFGGFIQDGAARTALLDQDIRDSMVRSGLDRSFANL